MSRPAFYLRPNPLKLCQCFFLSHSQCRQCFVSSPSLSLPLTGPCHLMAEALHKLVLSGLFPWQRAQIPSNDAIYYFYTLRDARQPCHSAVPGASWVSSVVLKAPAPHMVVSKVKLRSEPEFSVLLISYILYSSLEL